MKLLVCRNPRRLFSPQEAEAVAATLQADENDWTYVVKHDPKGTGRSFIEVREDDDYIIGYV